MDITSRHVADSLKFDPGTTRSTSWPLMSKTPVWVPIPRFVFADSLALCTTSIPLLSGNTVATVREWVSAADGGVQGGNLLNAVDPQAQGPPHAVRTVNL